MKRTIIILALLAVSAVVAVAAAGGGGTPQGTPFESAQVDFGVDGPDGQPVICSNGKELRVTPGREPRIRPTQLQGSWRGSESARVGVALVL